MTLCSWYSPRAKTLRKKEKKFKRFQSQIRTISRARVPSSSRELQRDFLPRLLNSPSRRRNSRTVKAMIVKRPMIFLFAAEEEEELEVSVLRGLQRLVSDVQKRGEQFAIPGLQQVRQAGEEPRPAGVLQFHQVQSPRGHQPPQQPGERGHGRHGPVRGVEETVAGDEGQQELAVADRQHEGDRSHDAPLPASKSEAAPSREDLRVAETTREPSVRGEQVLSRALGSPIKTASHSHLREHLRSDCQILRMVKYTCRSRCQENPRQRGTTRRNAARSTRLDWSQRTKLSSPLALSVCLLLACVHTTTTTTTTIIPTNCSITTHTHTHTHTQIDRHEKKTSSSRQRKKLVRRAYYNLQDDSLVG